MKPLSFRNPEYLLLAVIFILLLVLSFLSQGYYGGADNINHYFISRYSFTYPKLFLNPWGRPLYTILSSPFAQFGFQGIKVFNVILGTLSALFLMKTARELKLSQPWMGIIILTFTPLYMIMLFTAMTEILFSFVFIYSLYLFFSKRYIAAAIVISFLPFARTEGYFLIPILFLGLLMRRQWKAIPLLGTGFIFFSIIGAYQFKSLLWVIQNNPYPLIHPLYHTPGPFWTLVLQSHNTFGLANLALFGLGSIMLLVSLFNPKRETRIKAAEILLMFMLPVLGYYFFHSFMYSKGWAGSLGFIRVLAAIIPPASMIALYGTSLFSMIAGNRNWLRTVFNVLIIATIIFFNFRTYRFPVPLGNEEKIIKKACDWVKTNYNPLPPMIYTDFNVPYFLGTDPYNIHQSVQLIEASVVKHISPGSLFIWDSHFGPNECRIPLDTIMQDPYMHLIRMFRPKKAILTLGYKPYEIYVFGKNPLAKEFDNYFLIQSFIDEEDSNFTPILRKVFDFESASPDVNSRIITANVASGRKAFLMDKTIEFSPGLDFSCRDLKEPDSALRVKARVKVYSEVPFSENTSALVISLENYKGSYCYKALYFDKTNFTAGRWHQAFLNADLPRIRSKDDVIKVYVWHTGKKDLIIDDLIIDILADGNDQK